ncbi:MAG: hypothetical protein ACLFPL_02325 [Candidatus Nanoarchaeia archaeon]
MDKNVLLTNLEYMKSDIYYLSNKIASIETHSHNYQHDEQKNELAIIQIRDTIQEFSKQLQRALKRIEELELNQEHTSEYIDDIDSKTRKNEQEISKMSTQHSFTSGEIEALKAKLSEVEESLNSQISNIYDNVFNEILNLKQEIEILKTNKK